jgi:hypothetical protein
VVPRRRIRGVVTRRCFEKPLITTKHSASSENGSQRRRSRRPTLNLPLDHAVAGSGYRNQRFEVALV